MRKNLANKFPNNSIIRPVPMIFACFDKISFRNVKKIGLFASISLFLILNFALAQENAPSEPELSTADKSHWAFQAPKNRPLPTVKNSPWTTNPIDFFILEKLEAKQLSPSQPATKEHLIRRVTLDLIGLPPTIDEINAFINDQKPNAYEALIDRLLSSPHYGERWSLFWLDLARYAESNGYEADGERSQFWRYRDYVLNAFNSDKPYYEFILEQLAGDILAKSLIKPNEDIPQAILRNPKIADLLNAVGFNRCGPTHMVGGNTDQEVLRQENLTEMTTAVGSVFMGLTIGCARCHDHKFDPLSQVDYYRMQGFFGSTYFKEIDIVSATQKKAREDEAFRYKQQLTPLKSLVDAIDKPVRDKLTKAKIESLDKETRIALATDVKQRSPQQHKLVSLANPLVKVTWDEVLDALTPKAREERDKIKARMHDIEARKPQPSPQSFSIADNGTGGTNFLKRGNPKNKGPRIEPGFPRLLAPNGLQAGNGKVPDRLDLAQWLIRSENPLTAKVMVNRIWQQHFGTGIVATPSDYGIKGIPPTHPELLDWLALEFVNSGWSIKHIHKQIVLSSTYRQTSKNENLAGLKEDPENKYLWRMNRKRMDAEILRDSMIFVAGKINQKFHGPMIKIPLEPEVYDLIFTEGEPDGLWLANPDPNEHFRRSVYLFNKRNVRLPVLEVFDQPDTLVTCPIRNSSTHAPQALTMLNGPLSQELCLALAANIIDATGTKQEDWITLLWQRALGRKPTPTEQENASSFLTEQAEKIAALTSDKIALRIPKTFKKQHVDPNIAAAFSDLCLALYNTNEFVYRP
ncbi:MAG: DUF1553 domain-containing protein [Planctomycetes bacterium]|nr:DUF1553 domain-containing protein [Planctomycetota bacterium]